MYERVVLDTNIWIFGLRATPDRPACAEVLRRLSCLSVYVPRQILLELRANFTQSEIDRLFRLLTRYPKQIQFSWDKVEPALIQQYQRLGCKLGDAAVAAHMETLQVKILISENRDFLTEITGLLFRVFNAEAFLQLSPVIS